MTPFAHVSLGYLATQTLDIIYTDLNFNTPGLIITGVVGGNFPDLDFLFVKNKLNHRNTITHTPIFWTLMMMFVYFLSTLFNNQIFNMYSMAFFAGILTHFFADWFAAREKNSGGIRLFYPFSTKHYGLFPLKDPMFKDAKNFNLKKYLDFYMHNRFLFYSEIILILTGLFVFLNRSFYLFLEIIFAL